MFNNDLRNYFNSILTACFNDELLGLSDDTKNRENTGTTFESFCLDKLTRLFNLTPLDVSLSRKKSIHPKGTDKSVLYQGTTSDGDDVFVFDFPKSSPDFLVVHPASGKSLGIECKSNFTDASDPTFNAGLNDGDKVRHTIYLFYSQVRNQLIVRSGEQFLPSTVSTALDEIDEKVSAYLSQLTDQYKDQLGLYRPWYPRRTKYETTSDLWTFSHELQELALDWACK